MSVRNDPHFAGLRDIPRVPATATVRAVFLRLSSLGRGGFLLAVGPTITAYIIAHVLAERVMAAADGSVEELARIANLPVGDVIASIATDAAVGISRNPVDVFAGLETYRDLQQQEDMVFRVEQGDQAVGYFLNHERVHGTLTQRVWFLCENPTAQHRNPDMDHGRCRRCPYKLAGAVHDDGTAPRD